MKHAEQQYQRQEAQSPTSLGISSGDHSHIDYVANNLSEEINASLHSEQSCSMTSSQCLFSDLDESISSFNDVSDEGIGRISSFDSSNTSCSIYSGVQNVDNEQPDPEVDLGFVDQCDISESMASNSGRSISQLLPFSNEPEIVYSPDDTYIATEPSSVTSSPLQQPSSQEALNTDSKPTFSVWEKPQTRLPRLLHWPRTSLTRLYKSLSPRIFRKSLVSNSTKVSLRKSTSQPERTSPHNLPEDCLQVPQTCASTRNKEYSQLNPSDNKVFIEPSLIWNTSMELKGITRSVSTISGSSEHEIGMPEVSTPDLNMSAHQQVICNDSSSSKACSPVPVNTHLHHPPITTLTTSSGDVLLSEAEIKSRRRVSLIMSEIIQTERNYVTALQFIIDQYLPELRRDDVPQMLRGKGAVIFGNLEKIYQFHSQYFQTHLETCENHPFLVGQYFLQHETMFYLYALYNKNKPKSDCLMMDNGKQFFREKQLELGDKMDLSSYLLKPVQRMGKYALLLKQLLKECPETELEYPNLKAAEEMVRFQLRHGNDLLAMDSLRNCDVNLQEQGRLLRQEEFLVFHGRKKSMRRVFLFEDLILFSKTKKGQQGQHDIYIYKTSFKTADIGLTENYGSSELKFEIWFRRRSLRETYVLQAASLEMKNAWVKVLSNLLWKQAIHNRESHIIEQATMGMGSKQCVDIKPSEDIQDYSLSNLAANKEGNFFFINSKPSEDMQDYSLSNLAANKEACAGNLSTSSNFSFVRNGNKRPLSIISVCSTSSSASCQSSCGLPGSLNLAFDPLDSPHKNMRTFLADDHSTSEQSDAQTEFSFTGRKTFYRRTYHASGASFATVRSYFSVMKSKVLRERHSSRMASEA